MLQQPQTAPRFPTGSPTFQVHKDVTLSGVEGPTNKTAAQLEQEIADSRVQLTNLRQQESKAQELKRAQEQDAKFKKLETLKETLETLNLVNGPGSKLSLADAMDLAEEKRKVITQIEQIEEELGFTSISSLPETKKILWPFQLQSAVDYCRFDADLIFTFLAHGYSSRFGRSHE